MTSNCFLFIFVFSLNLKLFYGKYYPFNRGTLCTVYSQIRRNTFMNKICYNCRVHCSMCSVQCKIKTIVHWDLPSTVSSNPARNRDIQIQDCLLILYIFVSSKFFHYFQNTLVGKNWAITTLFRLRCDPFSVDVFRRAALYRNTQCSYIYHACDGHRFIQLCLYFYKMCFFLCRESDLLESKSFSWFTLVFPS